MKTNQTIESRKGHINKYGPIDTEDDNLMVALGLRKAPISRHPELYIKTKYEKEELKRCKSNCNPISRGSAAINEHFEHIMGKLTVYLKNTEKSKTFRTTRTYTCYKSEVEDILKGLKDDRLTVNKHYFKY